MNSLRPIPLLLLAALVLSCSSSEPGPSAPSSLAPASGSALPPGSLEDPVGDLRSGRSDLPDLSFASIVCSGDAANLEVRYAAAFDPDTTVSVFFLDTDRDPTTGRPGITNGGEDGSTIGVEYFVQLNVPVDSVRVINALTSERVVIDALVRLPDGFTASIPLDLLPAVNGEIGYKVTSEVWLSPVGTSVWLDVAPDLGLAPARSAGCPARVVIDPRPGEGVTFLNCRIGRGVVPVLIPGSEFLDVADIDHTTVTVSGAGEAHTDPRSGEARRHESDVNDDGYPDLLIHFRFGDSDLDCSSSELTVEGRFRDGTPFSASAPVEIRDPSREGVAP